MGIGKNIMDVARSSLNALLDKAADAADPRRRLDQVPDAELEAELARRKAARETEDRVNDARAKVDAPSASAGKKPEPAAKAPGPGPGPASGSGGDRAAREAAARDREARVKAAKEARERETRERQAKRAGAGGGAGGGAGTGAGASASAGRGGQRPPGPRGADPVIAQYYARLELPYGTGWEDVKTQYRKMMRKYHPDLHGHSPEKLKAATEVSQALTQAYNELEKHLLGGPNRR